MGKTTVHHYIFRTILRTIFYKKSIIVVEWMWKSPGITSSPSYFSYQRNHFSYHIFHTCKIIQLYHIFHSGKIIPPHPIFLSFILAKPLPIIISFLLCNENWCWVDVKLPCGHLLQPTLPAIMIFIAMAMQYCLRFFFLFARWPFSRLSITDIGD